ncbi:hypothetical protein R3P38DRAFT_2849610 [Favolaschia claudopus]|uniref:Alpha-type protein kinase domain-containing protein n=1 Tax=Favolaschia claudopus TaxID=2862362 RepID=A0AAW0DY39_9AGAR
MTSTDSANQISRLNTFSLIFSILLFSRLVLYSSHIPHRKHTLSQMKEFGAFPTTQDGLKICQVCKVQSEELFFMENAKPGKAGRHVCPPCREAYRVPDTVSTQNRVSISNIRASNLNAQRGSTSGHAAFRAVGDQRRPSSSVIRPPPDRTMAPPPPPRFFSAPSSSHGNRQLGSAPHAPSLSSNTGHQRQGGPHIYKPVNHSTAPLFPRPRIPEDPGYKEAHSYYEEMRLSFQSKAYSQGNTQTIMLQCWLARMEPGKKKETLISDIYVAIPNIPVNIGAADLKHVVYHSLLPQIVAWLRDYPVSTIEFTLHTKHWLEILPSSYPDVNAIADEFFTLKNNKAGTVTRVFNGKKPAAVYLGISNRTYADISEYFESLDNSDNSNATNHMQDGGRPTGKEKAAPKAQRKQTRKKRTIQTMDEEHEDEGGADTTRTPSPPSKIPRTAEPETSLAVSPDTSTIKQALSMQVALRNKDFSKLLDIRSRDITLFTLPTATWAAVIATPTIFSDITSPIFAPRLTVISYSVKDQRRPAVGGFKLAYPGTVSGPVFDSNTTVVCLKQAFHTRVGPGDQTARVLYEGVSQLKFLSGELNILGWGTTMMNMVYAYAAGRERELGKPPFEVPAMRYVHAGIALPNGGEEKTAFLVEEWIDTESEGLFVKYIHNSSAKPRRFDDPAHEMRSQFLSFCQHVQYLKTDRAAYISDFQGGLSLLTDPQIISARMDIGVLPLFGGGNTNYDALAEEHECTDYCRFYGLSDKIFGRKSSQSEAPSASTHRPPPLFSPTTTAPDRFPSNLKPGWIAGDAPTAGSSKIPTTAGPSIRTQRSKVSGTTTQNLYRTS